MGWRWVATKHHGIFRTKAAVGEHDGVPSSEPDTPRMQFACDFQLKFGCCALRALLFLTNFFTSVTLTYVSPVKSQFEKLLTDSFLNGTEWTGKVARRTTK